MQQLPVERGYFDLPRLSAHGVDARVERRIRPAGGVDAQGQYLIVYCNLTTGAKGGSFDYTTFSVTDESGETYAPDADATDALLKTSPDLPNGAGQKLDPNTT